MESYQLDKSKKRENKTLFILFYGFLFGFELMLLENNNIQFPIESWIDHQDNWTRYHLESGKEAYKKLKGNTSKLND